MNTKAFNFSAPQAKPVIGRTTYQVNWIAPNLTGEAAIAALTDIFGADECLALLVSQIAVASANVCRKSAENGLPLSTILEYVMNWKPGMKPLADENAKAFDAAAKAVGVKYPEKTPAEITAMLAQIGITRY